MASTPEEVTWIALGSFSNKVAISTNSGKTWTNVTPIIPLQTAKCGKKVNNKILIGGISTLNGSALYSTDSFGNNWSEVNIDLSTCNAIEHNGTEWIAVGSPLVRKNTVFKSSNGVDWIPQTSVFLTEAYNVYWANNAWIVVGKSVSSGNACVFTSSSNDWIGIDSYSTTYNSSYFDTVYSMTKVDNLMLLAGEYNNVKRSGYVTWNTIPTQFTFDAINNPVTETIVYTGTYYMSFDRQTKEFMVSTDRVTWTKFTNTNSLLSSQTFKIIPTNPQSIDVNIDIVNSTYQTFSDYINPTSSVFDSVNEKYNKLKGIVSLFRSYYTQANSLKNEISQLKSNIDDIYVEIEKYINLKLSTQITSYNERKLVLENALELLEDDYTLTSNNYTTLSVLDTNFSSAYSAYQNANPVTISILNTLVRQTTDHRDKLIVYLQNIEEYITVLKSRDIEYKELYEKVIEDFQSLSQSYLTQIEDKLATLTSLSETAQDFVQLIGETYASLITDFSSLNDTVETFWNQDTVLSEAYVQQSAWLLHLVNVIPLSLQSNEELQTVNVKTKLQVETETFMTENIYSAFPLTLFQDTYTEEESSQFVEIDTIVSDSTTIKDNASSKHTLVENIYDVTTIRNQRTEEIEFYTTPLTSLESEAYTNIVENIQYYLNRDRVLLNNLNDSIESTLANQNAQSALQTVAIQEAILEKERIERIQQETEEQKKILDFAAQEYQAEVTRYTEELAALESTSAAESLILEAENRLAEAQLQKQMQDDLIADAVLYQQQLATQRAAAIQREVDRRNYEDLLASLAADKARREAEKSLSDAITSALSTFRSMQLSKARILYYVYFDLIGDTTTTFGNTVYNLFPKIGESSAGTVLKNLARNIITVIREGFNLYDTYRFEKVSDVTDIQTLYEKDFNSIKTSILTFYNTISNAKFRIQDYLDSIDLTEEFSNLQSINPTTATSIESTYNSLVSLITDELDNLTIITDITLTLPNNVTIQFDNYNPLQSVKESNKTSFYQNLTTNIPTNVVSGKKITGYLIQLNTYIYMIRRVSDMKVSYDEKFTQLTNDRANLADSLEEYIDFSNSVSVTNTLQPGLTTIDSILSNLNSLSFPFTIYNPLNLEAIGQNGAGPNLITLESSSISQFDRRKTAIVDFLNILSSESNVLQESSVLTSIGNLLQTEAETLFNDIVKFGETTIYALYRTIQNTLDSILFKVNPYGSTPTLQSNTLFTKYRYISDSRYTNVKILSENLRVSANFKVDVDLAKKNYYTNVGNCIVSNIEYYPVAVTQPTISEPGFTYWLATQTYYNQWKTLQRNIGKLSSDFIDSVSLRSVTTALQNIGSLRNEYITSVTNTVLTNIQTQDESLLLQFAKDFGTIYFTEKLQFINQTEFPSDEDITNFSLQNVTTELKNISAYFDTVLVSTFFNNKTITQILSDITNFNTQYTTYQTLTQNLQTSINDIAKYKQNLAKYTAKVAELQNAIDRKASVVSHFLEGTFDTLELSSGTGKTFICGIKPTFTTYWEEVSGDNETYYSLYDDNWLYYNDDKVSYNTKVYKVINTVPLKTYEDGTHLVGHPPLIPKYNSLSNTILDTNTKYWTYLGPYLNTSVPQRPSLHELRSYDGELYKCIKVFLETEPVSLPSTDPVHWLFIPQTEYANQGAIPYYGNSEIYVPDFIVTYKIPLLIDNARISTERFRLGRFKAKDFIDEEYPIQFRPPALEITDEIDENSGFVDPDTNEVVPGTQVYIKEWRGGTMFQRGVPRYGKTYQDPWRLEGLLRNIRYSVALGPELAILLPYKIKNTYDSQFTSQVNNLYSGGVSVTAVNGSSTWTTLVNAYTTQSNRLIITGPLNQPLTASQSIEQSMREVHDVAYDYIIALLDDRIQNVIKLKLAVNTLKQQFYSLVQDDIDANPTAFLDSYLSTTGNVVFRDLGIGSTVWAPDFYNTHIDTFNNYERQIKEHLALVNDMLGLDLLDYVEQSYEASYLGGVIFSTSSTLNINATQCIPITDWRYIQKTENTDTQIDLDENLYPIMSRVRTLFKEAVRRPDYINDTARLLPASKGVSKLANILIGFLGGVLIQVADPLGIQGIINPSNNWFALRKDNQIAMNRFLRNIQNNVKDSYRRFTVSNEILLARRELQTTITRLEDTILELENTPQTLQTVPEEIDLTPPANAAEAVEFPTRPETPRLKAIRENREALDAAQRLVDDLEAQIRNLSKPSFTPDPISTIERGRDIIARPKLADTLGNFGGTRGTMTVIDRAPPVSFVPRTPKPDQTITVKAKIEEVNAVKELQLQLEVDAYNVKKTELDAQLQAARDALTQEEAIVEQNARTQLENDQTMRQFNSDLDNYETRRIAAQDEYNRALANYDENIIQYNTAIEENKAAILNAKKANAKILAEKAAALKDAKDALKTARTAQEAYVVTHWSQTAINAVRRSTLVTAIVRVTRVVQAAKQSAFLFFVRTGVVARVGAVSRYASAILSKSRIARVLGGPIGTILAGTASALLTAYTEGAFDDTEQ